MCNCKIIYIGRNPLDNFISSRFYYLKIYGNEFVDANMMEEYFDKFCLGKFPYGPFEDHALGYWNSSVEFPDKVLFIKYEDLKADSKAGVRRKAEFVERPFTIEEENEGVVDGIAELCSIGKLKEVEVNKSGRVFTLFENKLFFRKGEVGDWIDYLTPAMAQRLESIVAEKLKHTGLSFK